jgi:hypothetical protein
MIASFHYRSAPMRIRHRLVRLERTARGLGPIAESPERPLTDDEEADLTGEHLWLTPDWELHSRMLARNPRTADKAPAYAAWHLAAKAARAAGHTTYHVDLRPEAMAVWLTMKPDVLEHQRTHGRWICTAPPGEAAPTLEEFRLLPVEERVRILRSREMWPGYWSKIGPVTASRRRRQS